MTTLIESSPPSGPDATAPAGSRLLVPPPRRPSPIPALDAATLTRLLAQAGLVGHGGAGFPTWRKIAAVSRGKRPIVIANGAEGEPASRKDHVLLGTRPDLVLDGLAIVAHAVRAAEVVLVLADPRLAALVRAVIANRRHTGSDRTEVRVELLPDRFLSGEETAVVRWLSGGPAAPQYKARLLVERGLHNRPTLVQNVETLAQLSLIARHGPQWYRTLGSAEEPGTMLLTISGAVRRPGVVEAPGGLPVGAALQLAGGVAGPVSAVLLGGYGGGWLATRDLPHARLARSELKALGSSLGAGVLVALPSEACGLIETARVAAYLAEQSAGQCGPCLNGLPRLAELVTALAHGPLDARLVSETYRIAGLVEGRGACHHPDGAVRFVRSALRVFSDEVTAHLAGSCTARSSAPVLPIGQDDADWRP